MRQIILILMLLSTPVFAQTDHSKTQMDCRLCHSCQTPSKTNPCLQGCPHRFPVVRKSSDFVGPDRIVIDELRGEMDIYSSVDFSHQNHASMSKMSGGCTICHHQNPPGKIVACKTCHKEERNRTDIHKLDLKGAYHRQCMDCHRQWDTSDDCTQCHGLNTPFAGKSAQSINAGDKRKRRKISKPDKKIFHTRNQLGPIVTFNHKLHLLFKSKCADCHQNESCAKCHGEKSEPALKQPPRAATQIHRSCSDCHDTRTKCAKCHKDK